MQSDVSIRDRSQDRDTSKLRLTWFGPFQERFYAMKDSLGVLREGRIDLDKLVHDLITIERKGLDLKRTQTIISKLLSLRTVLRAVGPGVYQFCVRSGAKGNVLTAELALVRAALDGSSSELLSKIQNVSSPALSRRKKLGLMGADCVQFLVSPQLEAMGEAIDGTINEDIALAKGSLSSQNARVVSIVQHFLLTARLLTPRNSMLSRPIVARSWTLREKPIARISSECADTVSFLPLFVCASDLWISDIQALCDRYSSK